jgi:hypothetical protein
MRCVARFSEDECEEDNDVHMVPPPVHDEVDALGVQCEKVLVMSSKSLMVPTAFPGNYDLGLSWRTSLFKQGFLIFRCT